MASSLNLLMEKITTWKVSMFSSYIFRIETSVSRNQHLQDQLARMVVLLLLASLCCPLHAQNTASAPSSNSTTSNSSTSISPSSNSSTSISPSSNSSTSISPSSNSSTSISPSSNSSTSISPSSNSPTSISPTSNPSGSSAPPQLAQSQDLSNDFITSETNIITPETRVLISAPYAIYSTSLYVFTTGIPIRPVYIQAPSGLLVWLTIQCHGGAARVTVPQFVANFTMVQTDPTGEWILPSLPLNNSWPVTGLGIKFNQNISIANDALGTLLYGKGADNDIVGKATMTITLNWNATSARENRVIAFTESKSIYIWAPTALTSLSTFQATVAGVCILGIFGLCWIGCLNSAGVAYIRRFNVSMARETRDQQECEQNRVFNPIWMPCAPSQPGYYNIESTPNSMLLAQRRMEIKTLILRTPTTFNLLDRLTRVKYLKSSNYGWFGLQLPCATAPPRRLLDWSSDDEFPVGIPLAARRGSHRGSPQAKQFQEVAMMRQQLKARPSIQLLPNYSQQRAPSYNWQQSQAEPAMYNTQNQMYPGAPNYPQQRAQAPAINNPQALSLGAPGNRVNYETITVGYAFIHPRFVQDVPTDAKALFTEIPGPGDFSPYEAQEHHSASSSGHERAQRWKGKEPMRDDDSLELLSPGYQEKVLHTILPGISLYPAHNHSCHLCELVEEDVKGSLASGSVSFEGGVSELREGVFPREEVRDERKSEDCGTASERFGSPLSELYEDVVESCSPTNSIPDVICRTQSPLSPMELSS